MGSKGAVSPTPTPVYEDFVPSSKVFQEEQTFETIHLNLPDFKKEEIKVVLTSTGILKISGQRPIGQNKWQRFQMEFTVAENCDKSRIRARIENGILRVQQPIMTSSAVKKDKELAAKEDEHTPAAKRQNTSILDNADINTPAKDEPKNNSPKISEQAEAKSVAEKKLPADKSSSSSSSSSESTDEETDDEPTGNASCLAANLKKPRRVMKMTLVALSVLGIGLYVANVMKSANEAEE